MSANDLEFKYAEIPLWKPDDIKQSFDVLPSHNSGRIPVTRLEHWREFDKLLEHEFFNRADIDLVYRGHRRCDWSLIPTLARFAKDEIITEELATAQLSLFRKTIRGRIIDHSLFNPEDQSEIDELWSIGQHHELMTPLLDWSYSPYVALFFAFAEQDRNDETDNPYRAIYVLNKSFIDYNSETDLRVMEPRKDDHGRLVNQAGLFTFSPYGTTIENKLTEILNSEEFTESELKDASTEEEACIIAKYICKIYVKNEDQQSCLKHLRRMNIHHASLFPDLIGAAKYCNINTAEKESNKNRVSKERVNYTNNVEIESSNTIKKTTISAKNEISISNEQTKSIHDLLVKHSVRELSEENIETLSLKLTHILKDNWVVDWQERQSIMARIRNNVRVVLRQNQYKETVSDEFLDDFIGYAQALKE
ncbi:FRG domain-containing protein [Psychrobacter sp. PAMC 21119]|uniref:FRG domain-containing protein n=1 Tax=Psychrobacter sp. PAMC 21119 TaxID=1112209 RepID=UPI00028A03F6|nr:FRG domain-containing protein [Psychrobacter sp. PAMC 21119]